MKKIVSKLVAVTMSMSIFFCGCVSASNDNEDADGNGYADKIYLYNWSEYMTEGVLEKFKQEYGIEVVQSTYESNDELLAKLLAGGGSGEYDIAVPSNYFISAMLENDLLEEIDHDAIKNLNNIEDCYKDQEFDKGNKYSVPYLATISVWLGNKKFLQDKGISIKKVEDLKNSELKNNIVLTDDAQNNVGMGMLSIGEDFNCNDLEKIKQAGGFLKEINSNVKAYSTVIDARDMLAKGEVGIGYIYGGEGMQAMEENKDLELVMDEEPYSISMDSFVVLKGSKHKKEAQLFIDFILRPEIYAELENEYLYVNMNSKALDLLDENVKANPICNLSDKLKSNLIWVDTLPAEAISEEANVITEIKASR